MAAELYDASEAGLQSEAVIAALSVKLEKAVESLPPESRLGSLGTSVVESPVTILHRMIIDILVNKAGYLLHQRSLMKKAATEQTLQSRKRCIDAALTNPRTSANNARGDPAWRYTLSHPLESRMATERRMSPGYNDAMLCSEQY